MTRARLNWIELSATALGRCSLPTSVGINDWYAGPPNAWPQPEMNDSVSTIQTWITLGDRPGRPG